MITLSVLALFATTSVFADNLQDHLNMEKKLQSQQQMQYQNGNGSGEQHRYRKQNKHQNSHSYSGSQGSRSGGNMDSGGASRGGKGH